MTPGSPTFVANPRNPTKSLEGVGYANLAVASTNTREGPFSPMMPTNMKSTHSEITAQAVNLISRHLSIRRE